MEIIVRKATKYDATQIGRGVVEAVGIEHCRESANGTLEDVIGLFSSLAARDDSQYSYQNAIVATDDEGKIVGICVGYDGARLRKLRKAFIEEGAELFGIDEDKMPDETDGSEYYLDSLWVDKDYRRHGIGKKLIEAMKQQADEAGKPLGLLCDPENGTARGLYDKLGFKKAGTRPFLGTEMDNLRLH